MTVRANLHRGQRLSLHMLSLCWAVSVLTLSLLFSIMNTRRVVHQAPLMVLCSPVEAYQAFQAHRVSEPQFTEHGPLLVTRPSLMCRLGDRILPWTQAAPVVMGVLAFGGDWQNLLLPDQGVPVAVPPQQTRDPSKVSCCGSGLSQNWCQAYVKQGRPVAMSLKPQDESCCCMCTIEACVTFSALAMSLCGCGTQAGPHTAVLQTVQSSHLVETCNSAVSVLSATGSACRQQQHILAGINTSFRDPYRDATDTPSACMSCQPLSLVVITLDIDTIMHVSSR